MEVSRTRNMICILISCSALIGSIQVVSAEYDCGLKAGDWVRYDVSISSGSYSIAGAVKITIQSVDGTYIVGTYEANVEGYGSTDRPEQFSLNISTGIGSYSGFIIPANLTAGEQIPGEQATAQNVVDWHGRKAILANATSPFAGYEAQIYWDQATGVLLESTGSTQGTSFRIGVGQTNLWSSGTFGLDWPFWPVIIAITAIIAVVAVIVLRIKKPIARESAREPLHNRVRPDRQPGFCCKPRSKSIEGAYDTYLLLRSRDSDRALGCINRAC